MKAAQTKEKILRHTIALIQETGGDAERVTMREIARRAGVGVGLINHYFGSKEQLTEACVQTIVAEVISAFRPGAAQNATSLQKTKASARQVANFLFQNSQLSRLSILADMKTPALADNTMKTVQGFAAGLAGGQPGQNQLLQAFVFTAVLQVAFLRKDVTRQTLGIDLYNQQQRDAFIDYLVEGAVKNEIFNFER